MPFRFRHLPTLNEADNTANWEQTQTLLSEGLTAENLAKEAVTKTKLSKATSESFLQLATAANLKFAHGTGEVEWTAKSKTSANLKVATGLTAVAGPWIGSRAGDVNFAVFAEGGSISTTAEALGEKEIGTKVPFYWFAVGT